MELKEYWKPDVKSRLTADPKPIQKPAAKRSKHPLQMLYRRVRSYFIINTAGILFTAALLFLFPITIVQILLGFVILAQLWSAKRTFYLYQKIQNALSDEKTGMLHLLKQQLALILDFIKLEERLTIFVLPFALAGGFIAGGLSGSQKSVTEFFAEPTIQIGIMVTLILFIPIFYFLTKWINRLLFGHHTESLKQMIQSLENHTETG